MYNPKMANKGRSFENMIEYANEQYFMFGLANIQKISTPWTVVRQGKRIISAFPSGKSTLDFRGTVAGGQSISFDCKESENINGLPLKYIEPHQIEYIRHALPLGEKSFLLCQITPTGKKYYIGGYTAISYWDRWKENKGKKGYNIIPVESMKEITNKKNVICDYLSYI